MTITDSIRLFYAGYFALVSGILKWNFSEAGFYDVRSTEYSGPKHSDMILKDAIDVL